jgi:hypothetical protein
LSYEVQVRRAAQLDIARRKSGTKRSGLHWALISSQISSRIHTFEELSENLTVVEATTLIHAARKLQIGAGV